MTLGYTRSQESSALHSVEFEGSFISRGIMIRFLTIACFLLMTFIISHLHCKEEIVCKISTKDIEKIKFMKQESYKLVIEAYQRIPSNECAMYYYSGRMHAFEEVLEFIFLLKQDNDQAVK